MDSILAVSVVLYNTPPSDIESCLASLKQYNGNARIFIVDNSPTDVLKKHLQGANVNYLHNPSNPGFGAAHNIALRQSSSEGFVYHLIINADVSFSTDVLSPMLDYMEKNNSVGHLMPKVLNSDGSVQRLCKLVPTPADLLFRRFLPKKLAAASNRHFELHGSGYEKIMFVPYLSGCFMLLRNSALRDIGLFDERFFMYPEDIDLTRRMAEKYDTVFYPSVSVYHQHGAASKKSLRMLTVHITNLVRYFNKWGWFFDSGRVALNARTLAQFR